MPLANVVQLAAFTPSVAIYPKLTLSGYGLTVVWNEKDLNKIYSQDF